MEGERKKSMYRKDSEGWLKHTDFIILDMICLQLAYVLHMQLADMDLIHMKQLFIEIWQFSLNWQIWL